MIICSVPVLTDLISSCQLANPLGRREEPWASSIPRMATQCATTLGPRGLWKPVGPRRTECPNRPAVILLEVHTLCSECPSRLADIARNLSARPSPAAAKALDNVATVFANPFWAWFYAKCLVPASPLALRRFYLGAASCVVLQLIFGLLGAGTGSSSKIALRGFTAVSGCLVASEPQCLLVLRPPPVTER